MQERSVVARRSNAELSRIIDENDAEILDALNREMTLKEFQRLSVEGRNQIQRILGLDLSNPKIARRAYQEIVARVKGMPARQVRIADAEGNAFGITVRSHEDAAFIGGVLEGFHGEAEE